MGSYQSAWVRILFHCLPCIWSLANSFNSQCLPFPRGEAAVLPVPTPCGYCEERTRSYRKRLSNSFSLTVVLGFSSSCPHAYIMPKPMWKTHCLEIFFLVHSPFLCYIYERKWYSLAFTCLWYLVVFSFSWVYNILKGNDYTRKTFLYPWWKVHWSLTGK